MPQPPRVLVRHGPLVSIEGTLPSTAPAQLTRIGAFEKEGVWWCEAAQWARVESMLRTLGVHMQSEGEPLIPQAVDRDCVVTMLPGGDLRIQGHLPRLVRKDWLGRQRHDGYVGMSPLAIPDFMHACSEEHIRVAFDSHAHSMRTNVEGRMSRVDSVLTSKMELDVPLADSALRPYQRQILAVQAAMDGRIHLELTVGGGKTVCGIAWKRYVNSRRNLVICPSVAKGQWLDDIKRFDGSRAAIVNGFRREGTHLPSNETWVIMGQDTLMDTEADYQGWMTGIREWRPDYVIYDESHYAAGTKSNRSLGMRMATKLSKYAMLLTGTAMRSGPIDLWSQYDAIMPQWWGMSWFDYAMGFCNAKKRTGRFIPGKGRQEFWDVKGASNADVLHRRARYVSLRLTKADIQLQLPPQTRIPLRVDLTATARYQYDKLVEEYRKIILDAKAATPLEREQLLQSTAGQRLKLIGRMRTTSSSGRIPATVEHVADLVTQGKHPLVFAFYTDSLHGIRVGLTQQDLRIGLVDGAVSSAHRDVLKKRFLAGDLDVLVGQTKAMGTSWNMQDGSDTTVTHDMPYEPIDVEQTEGRVYRSGQTNPTFHYYSLGIDTKDDRALAIMLDKLANIQAVHAGTPGDVEGEVMKALDQEFFSESG